MQEQSDRIPSAHEFINRELRANPDASFAEVKQRAEQLGIIVPPFLYGRTRQSLGLPTKPQDAPANSSPSHMSSEGHQRAVDSDRPRLTDTAATETIDQPEAQSATAAEDPGAGEATTTATDSDEPKPKSGFQFAVQTLRMAPDISYQDLKARSQLAGFKLPPIVYGRAKALLGLVPVKPRKSKVPTNLHQVGSGPNGPGDMLDGLRSVEQLVAAARQLDCERLRLLEVLHSVQKCVADALEP